MKIINIIYGLILYEFLYPAGRRYFGFPELPSFTIEIIYFILFIYFYAFVKEKNKGAVHVVRRFKVVLIVYVTLVFFSTLVNDGRIYLTLKALVETFLHYIFLFLILAELPTTEKEQLRLIHLIYFLILLQIPVVIMQSIITPSHTSDSYNGTISAEDVGGTGVNAVISAFILAVLISRMMFYGFSLKYMVLSVATFVPTIVGGAKFGIILIPLAIASSVFSIMFLSGRMKVKQMIYFIIISVVIMVSVVQIFQKVVPSMQNAEYAGSLDFFFNEKEIETYESGKQGRFSAYYLLFERLNPMQVWIGLGTDLVARSEAFPSKKAAQLMDQTDVIILIATTGILGFSTYLIMIFVVIGSLKNYVRMEKSPFMQLNAYSFISISILMIASMLYSSSLTTHIGLVYWCILGVLMRRYSVLHAQTALQVSKQKGTINFRRIPKKTQPI